MRGPGVLPFGFRLLSRAPDIPSFEAPVSATVGATKFPCIEYVLYFVEGKTVMADRLWHVYISVQKALRTALLAEGSSLHSEIKQARRGS